MSEPSDGSHHPKGRSARDSWEQRAAGVAGDLQRWLIRAGAKSMRDEFSDQVKGQVRRALRSQDAAQGDSWATATSEPPDLADEAPECAWCPVCRAARRISQARSGGADGGARLSDAADVVAGAVRDALAGIDAVLSYRPGGPVPEPGSRPASGPREPAPPAPDRETRAGTAGSAGDTAGDHARGPEDEPGDRG